MKERGPEVNRDIQRSRRGPKKEHSLGGSSAHRQPNSLESPWASIASSRFGGVLSLSCLAVVCQTIVVLF